MYIYIYKCRRPWKRNRDYAVKNMRMLYWSRRNKAKKYIRSMKLDPPGRTLRPRRRYPWFTPTYVDHTREPLLARGPEKLLFLIGIKSQRPQKRILFLMTQAFRFERPAAFSIPVGNQLNSRNLWSRFPTFKKKINIPSTIKRTFI